MNYLCIAGPTASGKTAAALAVVTEFARTMPVEIISVDSAAVYRGMDIGTAKPSLAERAQVRHHLLDILEPTQAYSVARFVADARALISEIITRGHFPLLVGGTMLYFKALFDGLDEMPAADHEVRAQLVAQAARDGSTCCTTSLKVWTRLQQRDWRQVTRSVFSARWRCFGSAVSQCQRITFASKQQPRSRR